MFGFYADPELDAQGRRQRGMSMLTSACASTDERLQVSMRVLLISG
jgi:hypothetical protein